MAETVASVTGIPEHIVAALRIKAAVFREVECLDQVLEHPVVLAIVEELDAICVERGVVGYHYTRACTEEIEANGLVARDGEERRRDFLIKHGERFSPAQLREIQVAWKTYFSNQQNRVRDRRIWFNMTLKAFQNGGAIRLLGNYGGEVVYMPLAHMPEIARILCSIGEPMIIECDLDTERLNASTELPWGKVWLSSYHASINVTAIRFDVDAFIEESVPPERIIRIRKGSMR